MDGHHLRCAALCFNPMCAINGLYSYRPTAPAVDPAELCATRDHMAARGPDGQGAWLSPDGRLGLGHRRLAAPRPPQRLAGRPRPGPSLSRRQRWPRPPTAPGPARRHPPGPAPIQAVLTDFRSVLQTLARTEPVEVNNLAGPSAVGLSFEQPVETLKSIAPAPSTCWRHHIPVTFTLTAI